MENASKALIIAGSVLIAMLVLSIFIWGWNRVSNYYKAEESAETVQQLYQKNKELESYNKQVIRGYELRSLYNLITDMNKRYSKNNGFTPITAQLKLVKRYDGDGIDISKNPIIELPKNNKYKDEDGTIVRDTLFYSDNDKDTLCRFMRVIYNGIYEGKNYSQQKKIFNESYFKCVDIKYNGELAGQNGKGSARVQSFKFEQIVRK